MLLEHIASPDDIKKLDSAQLPQLCREVREFLVDSVSQTGGHLASNLGVVELTVALHRVYDTERDRIVFDVGHQCYVHKAFTGRREAFAGLRSFGGISGFPKPEESIHDAFVAGHASNSVSVALGMARARTMKGEDYHVVALIGDGAMTGGLAYEGLNDAGASGEPLVVILNDNGMSIDPNVGGIATHLSRLRLRPGYYRFKKGYHSLMDRIPGGKKIYDVLHRGKTQLKKAIYPCSMFEDMGFTYLGPVDGHNPEQVEHSLRWARELKCPAIVHVRTVKGKGYTPAETRPEKSHGVGPFDPKVGPVSGGEDFSAVFGRELTALARERDDICAITAAMGPGTGLQDFAQTYPGRFFDVGIAEGHAVSLAAGMAKQGAVPVFAVYSSFLQRGFDMLLHDVALQHLHVVLAVDRSGLVGADGPTHHGCQEIGYLSQIPGMTVYSPADYNELRAMLRAAVEAAGPVAVRYPRGKQARTYPAWGGSAVTRLRDGRDVTLVSYGVMTDELLAAAGTLAERGVEAEVIKINRVTPLDAGEILSCAEQTGRLLVLEDCFENGSVGQQLAAAAAVRGTSLKSLILKNLKGSFAPQGSVSQLRRSLGLDADAVVSAVLEVLV